MDFFCKIDSLLRQCYLWGEIIHDSTVKLSFGHVWLVSDVQFFGVEIGMGKEDWSIDRWVVRFTFSIWRAPKEFTKEIETTWIDISSEDFCNALQHAADFMSTWDEWELARYIKDDRRMEKHEQDDHY